VKYFGDELPENLRGDHYAHLALLTRREAGEHVRVKGYYKIDGIFEIVHIDLSHSHRVIDMSNGETLPGAKPHREDCYRRDNLEFHLRRISDGCRISLSEGGLTDAGPIESHKPQLDRGDAGTERQRLTPDRGFSPEALRGTDSVNNGGDSGTGSSEGIAPPVAADPTGRPVGALREHSAERSSSAVIVSTVEKREGDEKVFKRSNKRRGFGAYED
jgi:hypothetical protein